jgi:hypothetical protein
MPYSGAMATDEGQAPVTLPGSYKFTEADRVRAQQVLNDVLDEMSDCFTLAGMFGPNADILRMVLTDQRITDALEDRHPGH